MTARFGVVHQVHPMPGPAFAETGRGQKSIHLPGMGCRSFVVDEPPELLRRGRQARQGIGNPAQPGAAVPRVGRGAGPFCSSLTSRNRSMGSRDQRVSRVEGAGWLRGVSQIQGYRCLRAARSNASGTVPGIGAGSDSGQGAPASIQIRRSSIAGWRKTARRRHLQLRVPIGDGLVESTLERLAGLHHRPRSAALQHGGPGIQAEPRFLSIRPVAGGAVSGQNRTDSFLEEFSDRSPPKRLPKWG